MVLKVIGALIALAAAWRLVKVMQLRRDQFQGSPDLVQVIGVVKADHGLQSGDQDAGARAEVEFTTRDGRVVSGVVTSRMYLGGDVTGKQVPVWYDPEDPESFRTEVRDGDSSLLLQAGGPLFFLALGIYMVVYLDFVPAA